MQAALKQWTSPLKIWRIPFLTVMVATRIRTDMSLGNLGWIGRVGLLSHTHNIQMDLLPGEPQYIGSGSYYVADESATHSLMKQSYSPYR
jgi:anionic cell wall polymer biosynthesis LytR-Cps2A-Psr (LCP) family protein